MRGLAVRGLLLRVVYEIGNGRALQNARHQLHEQARVHARIDALERRLAPPRERQPVRAA